MTNEVEQFTQWVGSKKLYHLDHVHHLDGSDLPVIAKPTWTLTHHDAAGLPAPHGIGVLETSPDAHTGRITTGPTPGSITVTVTAVVSPTVVASNTFKINVAAHPALTARAPTLRISQHRDGPTH